MKTPLRERSLVKLLAPYWVSHDKWKGGSLALLLLALGLGNAWMELRYNDAYADFFNAMQVLDATKFWDTIPLLVAFLVVVLLVDVLRTYTNSWLKLRWRRGLFDHLLARWLSHHTYYRLERDSCGDNPDQRLTEDVPKFIDLTLTLTIGFVTTMASIGAYSYITWTKGGTLETTVSGINLVIPGYMFWLAVVFSILQWTLTHWSGWRLLGLNMQHEATEANLRYSLVQVRDNSEQIALYQGEAKEQAELHHRFQHIWQVARHTFEVSVKLNFVSGLMLSVSSLVPLFIMAPQLLAGKVGLGEMMATQVAWSGVTAGFGFFASHYITVADWRAVVHRLAQLNREIDAPLADGIKLQAVSGTQLRIQGLGLEFGAGQAPVSVGCFNIQQGERWMITGRSGAGKSTLLRAIAGLWRQGEGSIEYPADARQLFLPQKSYIPIGSLKAALSYPSAEGTFGDQDCAEALVFCQLGKFANRLHEESRWSHSLSMGEQQRLAFARVLLQRPDFLFMDEATSALDVATERQLFEALLQLLPEAAIISVAHRPALREFHQNFLHLGEEIASEVAPEI